MFSLFVSATAAAGAVIGAQGFVLVRPVAAWLGAEGSMLEDCVLYGRITLLALPALMLQYAFQSFFITAAKPGLGLAVTVAAGCTNMVLDALFTAIFPWGLASLLRLCGTGFDGKALLKACANGSSELMSNISMSIVSMLYNAQLIRYAGEDGIAAYGVLMYVSFVFLAMFIGYSTGVAPVVGFHYGAGSHTELRSLYRKSLAITLTASTVMLALAEALAQPLAAVFVSYDPGLFQMTVHAFAVYSFSFLFSGLAIFGSAFFTALNDGLTSVLISFLRTLVFQVGAVLVLPLIWGIDGVWLSIVAAEVMAALTTGAFLLGKRKKFHY